jgi:hypothetical protein
MPKKLAFAILLECLSESKIFAFALINGGLRKWAMTTDRRPEAKSLLSQNRFCDMIPRVIIRRLLESAIPKDPLFQNMSAQEKSNSSICSGFYLGNHVATLQKANLSAFNSENNHSQY